MRDTFVKLIRDLPEGSQVVICDNCGYSGWTLDSKNAELVGNAHKRGQHQITVRDDL